MRPCAPRVNPSRPRSFPNSICATFPRRNRCCALIAADALAAGEVLHVLTPLMPWPLLQALCERGLLHHAHDLADHGVRVVIERPR
jgi:hypothetical protein